MPQLHNSWSITFSDQILQVLPTSFYENILFFEKRKADWQ
jgi:hypothetical protein